MITIEPFNNGYSIQFVFENGINFLMIQHDSSYSTDKNVEIAVLNDRREFITKEFIEDLDNDIKGWVDADEAVKIMELARVY